jgi:outer membrane protein assembly factor BamB
VLGQACRSSLDKGFSLSLVFVVLMSCFLSASILLPQCVGNDGAGIADDWPMFHHDPQHSGYSTSTAPNTNTLLWNYTTNGFVRSSPAVVGGRVYVGSMYSGHGYGGSLPSKVYCLDAVTGVPQWSYTISDYVDSSPAVVSGKVYIGSGYIGFGLIPSKVYCLDAATGSFLWSYTAGGAVHSSPAVVDGKVYVGSYDNNVYCLDAATGAPQWSYNTGRAVYSSPAVANGKVYIGSLDSKVCCLDANTGALLWSYTTGGEVWSSPAVADGKVYVGSGDNNFYCLNAATGALQWSYASTNGFESPPAVVNGRVYVGSFDKKVYCFGVLAPSDIQYSVFKAEGNQAYFVYADPYRMTRAVASYDVASGSILYGMCDNAQNQAFDNYPQIVSQNATDRGRLLLSNKVVLLFGSRNPHWCVRYLEDKRLTPVYFENNGTHVKFIETATGANIVSRALSTIDFEHEDYFILMAAVDENNNHVFINYGFEWKGTWSSGIYFKSIYPNIQTYTNAYYVIHWIDTNADGLPQPNEMTQIAP